MFLAWSILFIKRELYERDNIYQKDPKQEKIFNSLMLTQSDSLWIEYSASPGQ